MTRNFPETATAAVSRRALLAFNPERTEAKKAIDTCSIQLRNLKAKL